MKPTPTSDDPHAIDPATFLSRRQAGENLVLIDIRFPIERWWKRIPGALVAPAGFGTPRLPTLLDGAIPVLHCHGGVRTRSAVRALHALGIPALHLAGGIAGWMAAGLPVCSMHEMESSDADFPPREVP